MGWFRKICLCAIALVSFSTKADASGSIRYMEPYSVEGLGIGMPVVPESREYKRYHCRPSEQYANSIWCNFSELKGGVSKLLTILHLSDNIVTYVNKQLSPAFFTNSEVDREITRLSRQFNGPAHIYRSPKRPGFPGGIIATWGDIELQPLTPDDLAVLAVGKSTHVGVLVDFLVDFHESARAGLPVYSLHGGKGYVWIARFDQRGKGKLRFFAADPSQMAQINSQVPPPYYADPTLSSENELELMKEERKKAQADAKKAEMDAEKAKAEAQKGDAERQRREAESKAEGEKSRATIRMTVRRRRGDEGWA